MAGRCRRIRSRPGSGTPWGHGMARPLSCETAGFNDKSWLDAGGTPHTDALRTTERLRRTDFGHMEITFTFDDPKTFTKPWSATVKFNLLPDTDLLEHHCDNEKWLGKVAPVDLRRSVRLGDSMRQLRIDARLRVCRVHVRPHEGTGRDDAKAVALRRLDRPLRERVGHAASAQRGRHGRLDKHDRVRVPFVSQRGNLSVHFGFEPAILRVVAHDKLSGGPNANARHDRVGWRVARGE